LFLILVSITGPLTANVQ